MRRFNKALALLAVLSMSALSFANEAIRVNVDSVPITLDPPVVTDGNAAWVLHHIADRLIEEPSQGFLKGNLAERWTISSDKKLYCFFIPKGRKFHDGSDLDAYSVGESFKRAVTLKSHSRVGFYLGMIDKIDVQNANTICVSLKKPLVNFLRVLADSSFSIHKEKKGEILYSGSYELVNKSDQQLTIKRKWDNQLFTFTRMAFDEALPLFKKGELEILRNNGVNGVAEMSELTNLKVTMPDERTFMIAFNLNSPVFNTLEARERFLKLVDWEALNAQLKQNKIEPSNTLLSPSLFRSSVKGLTKENVKKTSELEKPKAFVVLTQMGYKLKPYVVKALRGMNYRHLDLEKKEFLKVLKAGEFDVVFTGYGVTVRDWDFMSTLFHSESAHNMIFLNDKSIDEKLVAARSMEAPLERMQMYEALLQRNYNNLWYLPVAHSPLIFALSSSLGSRNYKSNDMLITPWFELDGIYRK